MRDNKKDNKTIISQQYFYSIMEKQTIEEFIDTMEKEFINDNLELFS